MRKQFKHTKLKSRRKFKPYPLHKAARHNNHKKMKQLIDKYRRHPRKFNTRDGNGYTPVYLAALHGRQSNKPRHHFECLFALLEGGANPHVRTSDDKTLLHDAIKKRNLRWIQLLLWYNHDYKHVKSPIGTLAITRIKNWDRESDRKVLKTLNDTIQDIKSCREWKKCAKKAYTEKDWYEAASLFYDIACLYTKYAHQVQHDIVKGLGNPALLEPLLRLYQRKTWEHYQYAQKAFHRAGVKSMNSEEKKTYFTLLQTMMDMWLSKRIGKNAFKLQYPSNVLFDYWTLLKDYAESKPIQPHPIKKQLINTALIHFRGLHQVRRDKNLTLIYKRVSHDDNESFKRKLTRLKTFADDHLPKLDDFSHAKLVSLEKQFNPAPKKGITFFKTKIEQDPKHHYDPLSQSEKSDQDNVPLLF